MKNTNRSTGRTIRFDNCLRYVDLDARADLTPANQAGGPQAPDKGMRIILDALIRAHRPELVAAARRRGKTRHDAEDLVQDLCLQVLEGELVLPVTVPAALDLLLAEIGLRCDEEDGE